MITLSNLVWIAQTIVANKLHCKLIIALQLLPTWCIGIGLNTIDHMLVCIQVHHQPAGLSLPKHDPPTVRSRHHIIITIKVGLFDLYKKQSHTDHILYLFNELIENVAKQCYSFMAHNAIEKIQGNLMRYIDESLKIHIKELLEKINHEIDMITTYDMGQSSSKVSTLLIYSTAEKTRSNTG